MRWNSVLCSTVALSLNVAGLALAQARGRVQPSPTTGHGLAPISVGPNVQVSGAFPKLAHYESSAAADPSHAGRLLACSHVMHMDHAKQSGHCYASFDNGKTWSSVLELDDNFMDADPAMAYGRGDTVFYTMNNPQSPDTAEKSLTHVFRSLDGGRTWHRSSVFPRIDRQWIAVDRTAGKFAGRVYINGMARIEGIDGTRSVNQSSLYFYWSVDGGRTFRGPIQRATLDGSTLLGETSPVVLSDGTIVFLYGHIKKGEDWSPRMAEPYPTANAILEVLISRDGGEIFAPAVPVSEWFLDRERSGGAIIGQLAVDPGSPFFKDRLYAVWADAATGRSEIRFSYSADKGRTWSTPQTVNDDREPIEKSHGPDHFLPAVEANKNGAVVVAWYDRRESSDNLGWKIRAATSLDGGETFSPSFPVSDGATATFTNRDEWVLSFPRVSGGAAGSGRGGATMRGRPLAIDLSLPSFFNEGGHTTGMAVDADGVFHPVWVDNRTGIAQLWTAPITVTGTVEKHGARELADLDDITDRLVLEARATTYDRPTNTLTLTARLKNAGKDPITGPVKARLVVLRSPIGVPEVVGADNGVGGVGAIWDLSATIPSGGLRPDASAAPKTFTVRLSDVRPLEQGREFKAALLHFETRVYGRASNRSARLDIP
jgi:hypothetical protein